MKVKDLLNYIDTFAPWLLAEEWDNPGLQVGSYDDEVKRVGICLDAVPEAVIEAHEKGCEVLLTHHPLIFRGIKKISVDSDPGRTIKEAIKRDVNIIAAHTNWDVADEGVNITLASFLELEEIKTLSENRGNPAGFGLTGKIKNENGIAPEKFLEHVKKSWGLSRIDFYSEKMPEKISRVALCGGSGAEFWRAAKLHRADVYLTADMKYHELTDATRAGLSIGLCDHGEMERASLPKLAEKISGAGLETVLLDIKALNKPLRF